MRVEQEGEPRVDVSVVGLLVLSAVVHAGWNLLAKRSLDKQVFLWLATLASAVVFLVPFLLLYHPFSAAGWGFIALSGTLEGLYFILLGSAYQHGDLSLVYPLARGSAPVFVVLLASVFLGERIFWGAVVGICLVIGGVYTLHLKSLSLRGLAAPCLSLKERPSQLALLTGFTIGSYSVVDKAGVSYAGPLPYLYLVFLVSSLALLPYMALLKPAEVRREWRASAAGIVAVGVMFVVGFVMVLYALTASQVSYVAPVREVSVVFGAILGALVLREPFARSKIIGSALIFAGIVCIALAK